MVLGVLVVGASMAMAVPRSERPRRGPDPERLKQELGLSEDQWTRVHKIWSDAARERIRRQASVRLLRMDLRELMQAPAPDEKAVAAKVKELTDLQAAGTKGKVDQMLALKKVLTPEQQQKMMQLRRHHAGPGPDGPRGHGQRRGSLDVPDDVDESPLAVGDDEQ
jgi:Spy/CpxP family protein refolding chaperone